MLVKQEGSAPVKGSGAFVFEFCSLGLMFASAPGCSLSLELWLTEALAAELDPELVGHAYQMRKTGLLKTHSTLAT